MDGVKVKTFDEILQARKKGDAGAPGAAMDTEGAGAPAKPPPKKSVWATKRKRPEVLCTRAVGAHA